MAYVQSRRTVDLPDMSNAKENQPPKKPKKSTNDLFKKSKSNYRTARDILAPLPDGVSKLAKSPQPGFLKCFAKKRKGFNDAPLRAAPGLFPKNVHDKQQERARDTGYTGAAHDYCEGAAAEAKKRVDLRQAELAARRKGLGLDGQPLRRKGHPSKADFDKVFAQMEDLARPLEDEMINVQFEDAATGHKYLRQLRVGSTLDKFFERHTRKQTAVIAISNEIREVEKEILTLVDDIQKEKERMEKGSAEMESEMAELQKEVDEAEDQYKSEMKALKKQLRTQSDEVKKKIQDLKAFVS